MLLQEWGTFQREYKRGMASGLDSHLGGSDDGETHLEQPLNLDDGQVAERTSSDTGNDDSLGAVVDSILDELPVKVLVTTNRSTYEHRPFDSGFELKHLPVQNIDHRELVDRAEVESLLESRLSGRVVEKGLCRQEPSQIALFNSGEGVDGIGIVLLGVESGSDPVVERDEGTSVTGLGVTSKSDGLQQVGRPIRRDGGRGPHRPDEDDRLATVDQAVD